jgi:hypothetical protein
MHRSTTIDVETRMPRTQASKFSLSLILAGAILALGGCTKTSAPSPLARQWDCDSYVLSLQDDGGYTLTHAGSEKKYIGTYELTEGKNGGHNIKWHGEPRTFTGEYTFIQGPSSDGEIIMGRPGSIETKCTPHRAK